MTYKKYVFYFVFGIMLFAGGNLLIWKGFTESLLSKKLGADGDLARTGYVVDSRHPRETFTDLPVKHLEFKDYSSQSIDLITIGDSFSHGGAGGRNRYYQDYIASINGITVLNMARFNFEEGALITVLKLLNSGYLDKIKPRYIIIQSVERVCTERFAGDIDFNQRMTAEAISNYYKENTKFINELPYTGVINNANLKYLYYRFRYLFSDSPTRNIITKKLSQSFFNVPNDGLLLFFRDDVNNLSKQNRKSIESLNNNINWLSRLLAAKGIHLYFLPIVDKYNLYSQFILNNPYPASSFFEILRGMPKEYGFIDTKAILSEALHRGEKDIYYADDTHWSWRASELVFDKVRFK
jgi:hypothetical protein